MLILPETMFNYEEMTLSVGSNDGYAGYSPDINNAQLGVQSGVEWWFSVLAAVI